MRPNRLFNILGKSTDNSLGDTVEKCSNSSDKGQSKIYLQKIIQKHNIYSFRFIYLMSILSTNANILSYYRK